MTHSRLSRPTAGRARPTGRTRPRRGSGPARTTATGPFEIVFEPEESDAGDEA